MDRSSDPCPPSPSAASRFPIVARHELADYLRRRLVGLEASGDQLTWHRPATGSAIETDEVLRLLGQPGLVSDLAAFWPAPRPAWPAVGIVRDSRGWPAGPLLMRLHSQPQHLRAQPADPLPLERKRTLQLVRQWLGVSETPAVAAAWEGHGQLMARDLATIFFLRRFVGIRSWLATVVHMEDDPGAARRWGRSMKQLEAEMGLPSNLPHACAVRLRAT